MSNNNNTSRRGNSINNSSSSKGFLVLVFLAISGLTFCSYRFITNRGCLDFDFHNNNNDNNDNNNINREENKLREVDDIDNSVLSHTTADDNNNDSSKQQEQEQQNGDINDGIEREEDDFDVKGKRDDDHDERCLAGECCAGLPTWHHAAGSSHGVALPQSGAPTVPIAPS